MFILQDEGIDSDYQDDVQDEDSDRETDGKIIELFCSVLTRCVV